MLFINIKFKFETGMLDFHQLIITSEVFIRTNKRNTGYSQKYVLEIFTSGMERLQNEIERLSNQNTLLKQEVKSLKTDADF